MRQLSTLALALLAGAGLFASNATFAACSDVTFAQLQSAANTVYNANNTGGFRLNMWVTMVDETGVVCHVVNTNGTKGVALSNASWLGSRVISAQKANTANAFSLTGVSISSGALYAAVQPGGSLFGLQESNPVDASTAYLGAPTAYGTALDPLRGKRIGGVNVFGGGIALYKNGAKVGAIGVSGDTSCTDHAFAWRVRANLVSSNILGASPGGFELLTLTSPGNFISLGDHPACSAPNALTVNGTFGFVED